jgi:hypothetical protein
MKRKHAKTLALLFHRPTSANVKFSDMIALLTELGARIDESREGSRVGISWRDDLKVMHKPHPSPNMDKASVAEVRDWLELKGITP